MSFQFQEHYGGDIHGQRRELAEILREIELIENSSTDDRGLMNIISEQNDADGSITKLNIELREICDKHTHVHCMFNQNIFILIFSSCDTVARKGNF